MSCSKCDSGNTVKNGLSRGIQRYKCKNCNYNYTISYSQYQHKERQQRLVLILYLEGLYLHAIGKVLQVAPAWKEMRYYGNCQKTMDGFGVVLIEKESQTLIALKQKKEQG